MIDYEEQKAIWQKYTDEELTEQDIDEINSNLREFARALLKIQKNERQKEVN